MVFKFICWLIEVSSILYKSIFGWKTLAPSVLPSSDGNVITRDTIAVHNLATDGPLVYEASVGSMPVTSNTSTADYREQPYYDSSTGQIDHNASWGQQGYLSDHRFYHLTTGQVIRLERLSFYDGSGTEPEGGGSSRLRLDVTFSTRQNRRNLPPLGEPNNFYFAPTNPYTASTIPGTPFKPINKIVIDFPYDERTEVLEYTLATDDNFDDYGSIGLYDDTNALTMASSKLLDGGVPHDHGNNIAGHTRPYRVTIT